MAETAVNTSNKFILKEVMLTWLIVMIGGKLAIWMGERVPGMNEYSGLILSTLLIYVPLVIFYRRVGRIDFLNAAGIGRSIYVCLIASSILFSLSALVVWVLPFLSFHSNPILETVYFLFYQLIAVAFPEEFFFRGYMQDRLNKFWGKKYLFLGISFGPSLWVTALVFALSHSLISFQPWHALIFFPALIFGLLREKTNLIWASILFHAFCNLFSFFVLVK